MFESNGGKKKKLLFAGILGAISVTSYIIALSHQDYLTKIFTRGGWYLVFPVAAAFYFSFLHGTFASNVLSILGITASKKRPAKQRKVINRQAPVLDAQKHINHE